MNVMSRLAALPVTIVVAPYAPPEGWYAVCAMQRREARRLVVRIGVSMEGFSRSLRRLEAAANAAVAAINRSMRGIPPEGS